ncbi:MAG: hypothetical protein KAT05_14985 [Spirochaetes bacterium]|nr:hypothetical protein [Spirochaetota bacterium]
MRQKIYSFDVYDTCITRNIAYPQDLFSIAAENILKRKFIKNISIQKIIDDLAHLRKEAEEIARKKSEKEEIDIYEIYKIHKEINNLQVSSKEFMEEELFLEKKFSRPIWEIKEKIKELRANKNKIIFISDMYLPSNFIQEILEKYNIFNENDNIYVSGEIGLTKTSGKLFEYIIKKEKIKPSLLIHHGDNFFSDFKVPKKMGIKCFLFKESRLNRYELNAVSFGSLNRNIISKIIGISKVSRLIYPKYKDKDIISLAVNIVGPLLLSFVLWVLYKAKKDKIKRLYFVSCDGQILLKIAQQISKYIKIPECRYLYGSRQAWYLPSILDINKENMDWLFIEGHSTAPKDILKKLDITYDEVKELLLKYGINKKKFYKQLDNDTKKIFLEFIFNPSFKSVLKKKIKKNKEMVIKYFHQCGLLSSSNKFAVVDVGWALKTQRALKVLLEEEGYNNTLIGYYLGLLDNRLRDPNDFGVAEGFILENNTTNKYEAPEFWIFRYIGIIEHVFTIADHGSTKFYILDKINSKVIPKLEDDSDIFKKKYFINKLHEYIIHYTDEFCKEKIFDHFEELKIVALNSVKKYLKDPSRDDARLISSFVVGDDQNNSRLMKLAYPISLYKSIFYKIFRFFGCNIKNNNKPFWYEGAMALSNFWIRYKYNRDRNNR